MAEPGDVKTTPGTGIHWVLIDLSKEGEQKNYWLSSSHNCLNEKPCLMPYEIEQKSIFQHFDLNFK